MHSHWRAGTVLTGGISRSGSDWQEYNVLDLTTRKPLAGIPASEFSAVIGAKLRRKLSVGDFLQSADIQK